MKVICKDDSNTGGILKNNEIYEVEKIDRFQWYKLRGILYYWNVDRFDPVIIKVIKGDIFKVIKGGI